MKMIKELHKLYNGFFEKDLLAEIEQIGVFKKVPEGQELITTGKYIKAMPLLISGAIKILRENEQGTELLLYFLSPGETCAMTLSCCIGLQKSEIKAITETEVELVMIPIEKMETWTATYKSWRNFVFENYHTRLIEAIETIDKIAFLNMDDRLIQYLKEKKSITSNKIIKSTHQTIADDLHTSRVVVSRLLKKLEQQGAVKLLRNSIEIIQL